MIWTLSSAYMCAQFTKHRAPSPETHTHINVSAFTLYTRRLPENNNRKIAVFCTQIMPWAVSVVFCPVPPRPQRPPVRPCTSLPFLVRQSYRKIQPNACGTNEARCWVKGDRDRANNELSPTGRDFSTHSHCRRSRRMRELIKIIRKAILRLWIRIICS